MKDVMIADPEKIHAYMKCMYRSLDVWRDFFKKRRGVDWLSYGEIQIWLEKIFVTLRIMENVYIFDDTRSLIIETLGSGFPRQQHFDHIGFTKKTARYDQGRIHIAKVAFLDELFSNGKKMPSLDRIARSLAFDLLFENDVIEAFHFSGIDRIVNYNAQRDAFVCSWERISDGLLAKYVMLFDVEDGWSIEQQDITELTNILRERTSFITPMERTARSIDIASAEIHPRWIGRITLGPVFVAGITRDDHQLQRALDNMSDQSTMYSASRIIYEHVIADREVPIYDVRDQKGRLHKVVQKYMVRHEEEHHLRGATHVEKTLFADHDIVQKLDSEYLREIGHRIHGHQ